MVLPWTGSSADQLQVDSAAVQSDGMDLIGSAGGSHCTAAPMVPVCLAAAVWFCPACLAKPGRLDSGGDGGGPSPAQSINAYWPTPARATGGRRRSPPSQSRADTGSVFRKADDAFGRDLRRCSADLSRADATYLPRQRSSDSAIDHLGAYRDGCAAFGIARPGLGYSTHRRPLGPGHPDTALRPPRSRRPHPPTSSTAIGMRCEPSGTPTAGGHRLGGRRDDRRRRRCDASHLFRSPRRRSTTALVGFGVAAGWRHRLNIGWSRHISDALHSANYVRCHRFNARRPTAIPRRRDPPPYASTDRTRHVRLCCGRTLPSSSRPPQSRSGNSSPHARAPCAWSVRAEPCRRSSHRWDRPPLRPRCPGSCKHCTPITAGRPCWLR